MRLPTLSELEEKAQWYRQQADRYRDLVPGVDERQAAEFIKAYERTELYVRQCTEFLKRKWSLKP